MHGIAFQNWRWLEYSIVQQRSTSCSLASVTQTNDAVSSHGLLHRLDRDTWETKFQMVKLSVVWKVGETGLEILRNANHKQRSGMVMWATTYTRLNHAENAESEINPTANSHNADIPMPGQILCCPSSLFYGEGPEGPQENPSKLFWHHCLVCTGVCLLVWWFVA